MALASAYTFSPTQRLALTESNLTSRGLCLHNNYIQTIHIHTYTLTYLIPSEEEHGQHHKDGPDTKVAHARMCQMAYISGCTGWREDGFASLLPPLIPLVLAPAEIAPDMADWV